MSQIIEPLGSQRLADSARENVRRLVDQNRQDTGLDVAPVVPEPVALVGVIGAGTMGAAIAAEETLHGVPVVVHDADRRVLCHLPRRIAGLLAPELTGDEAQRRTEEMLQPSIALGRVTEADLVVESIVETFAAKNKLFTQIEPRMRPTAVLATNTSTIPVGRLAASLERPERFCGIHFCHPVRSRPLVEIVRGPRTNDTTVATAVAHVKALGKMPIVVQDGPGFLINRLLLPYLGEALELLLDGASMENIERTAIEFGMAMGPLTMLDEIGLDTTLQAGLNLSAAYPDRVAASPLLVAMIKDGRLGRKCGRGFYCYGEDEAAGLCGAPQTAGAHGVSLPAAPTPPALDADVQAIINAWARTPQHHTTHSIVMRLFLPMVLEATRIIADNRIRHLRDIDLSAIFGLGFPEARGGILWWADTLGAARIVEMLRPLAELGPRCQPTPMLRDMARRAGRFYR